jgi:polysaccharide export outer membrane protein
VLDDADFNGTFRVDEAGNIDLPILGELHISGDTVTEARSKIHQKLLDEKILNSPQVELSVLEYSTKEVTILGEVAVPGKYSILAPSRLVDVLALAGGITVAAGNEVQITSDDLGLDPIVVHYSKSTTSKTVENVLVHPGDTVQVKQAGIIYVLGAVSKPGGYVMQEDGTLTVLQAISLANGTNLSASVSLIHLLRRSSNGIEVDIPLPFNKMQHGRIADFKLQARDVLYVPTSKIKSSFINAQGILATVASASIYASTAY